MITLSLTQNTPEWQQFRLTHFGASESPAMLGVCPYKTRNQLLAEKKTGVIPPVDAYTQQRFDRGHYFEQFARKFAEKHFIKEDLFNCVGVLENSRISASFDGLTLDHRIVFEHKTLSQALRKIFKENAELPLHYRLQLEQQLLVSGAEKALFMASTWDENNQLLEAYHCEYTSDNALRQRILSGWQQFERDLADYVPTEKPEKTPAKTLAALLPLQFQSPKKLILASNIDDLEQHASTVLNSIHRNLVTERDFGEAENVIKWCKTSEDQLSDMVTKLIVDTPDLNYVFGTIKTLQSRMRDIRLDLDKQVKTEKARIKHELMTDAFNEIKAHYQENNVDAPESEPMMSRLQTAIKGLKNRDTLQNALDRVVVAEKTALTQQLESGELTQIISLEDINHALSPLFINDAGLKQCGFNFAHQPIRVLDFPKLIQRLIEHLSSAKLPKTCLESA